MTAYIYILCKVLHILQYYRLLSYIHISFNYEVQCELTLNVILGLKALNIHNTHPCTYNIEKLIIIVGTITVNNFLPAQ